MLVLYSNKDETLPSLWLTTQHSSLLQQLVVIGQQQVSRGRVMKALMGW